MKKLLLATLIASASCIVFGQQISSAIKKYMAKHPDGTSKSISVGTVSNGSLKNGKLIPYRGTNFQYFDSMSYVSHRAFVHHKVKKAVIASYKALESVNNRQYTIMECSNKNGGKIYPHRTHQNGLSIDFMMPLKKNNKPYYGLDQTGAGHYLLKFDQNGRLADDKSIEIDFDATVLHILTLEKEARKNGLRIKKIIINTDLKDELYAAKNGTQLKSRGIYVVQKLTPMINALHDDHYHIDFAFL
jgi:penicillin-insensitive murein endopeptidase